MAMPMGKKEKKMTVVIKLKEEIILGKEQMFQKHLRIEIKTKRNHIEEIVWTPLIE